MRRRTIRSASRHLQDVGVVGDERRGRAEVDDRPSRAGAWRPKAWMCAITSWRISRSRRSASS